MTHDDASVWRVEPFRALGVLRFGAGRADCRSALGQPDVSFRRSAWADLPADGYPALGLTLEFGPDDLLEAVEATAPARPVFEDVALLTGPGRDVLRRLAERSCVAGWNLGVHSVEEIGITLFSPSGPDPEEAFAGVSVFRRKIPAPPEFFVGTTPSPTGPLEVSDDRIGPARLGTSRNEVRSVFGEGMATHHFGWATDIFFCGIVAQYDAAGTVRRLVATSPTDVLLNGHAALGIPFREFVDRVTSEIPGCSVSDSSMTVGTGGPQVSISRSGADELPISAVSVGSLGG
ncbi:hypothetical protein ACIBVL_22185 [Streptomyces sp. NPDC049687]|uniref:hypothetical protein n=1 Tax=Streptomyces sp. NPDC049687 TaxID=3365596 RepID=UPI00378FAF25